VGPVLALFIARLLALRDTGNICSIPDKTFSVAFKTFQIHCQALNLIEETKISLLFILFSYFIFCHAS